VAVLLCNVECSAEASLGVAASRGTLRGSSAVAGDELRAGGLARGDERRSGGRGGARDGSGRRASNRSSGASVEVAAVTILLSDEPRRAETLDGVAAARGAVAVTAAGTGDELGAGRCRGRGCGGAGNSDGDGDGGGGYGGGGSTAIARAVVAVLLRDELRGTEALDRVTASRLAVSIRRTVARDELRSGGLAGGGVGRALARVVERAGRDGGGDGEESNEGLELHDD